MTLKGKLIKTESLEPNTSFLLYSLPLSVLSLSPTLSRTNTPHAHVHARTLVNKHMRAHTHTNIHSSFQVLLERLRTQPSMITLRFTAQHDAVAVTGQQREVESDNSFSAFL